MKYTIIIILSILAISCTKSTEDISLSSDIPVVSGFLSPNDIPAVQISELIQFVNDDSDTNNNMENLEVYLLHNEIKYQLTPTENTPGRYHYDDTLMRTEAGEEYYLEFMYNDLPVSSYTKVPLKPENFEASETTIELVRITPGTGGGGMGYVVGTLDLMWSNPDNGYYLVRYEYLEEDYDPVNENQIAENPEDYANFTSTPIQDSGYSMQENQFRYFGHYNMILFKITDEYAELYESLNQSSLEDLSEPNTNITNGKGIFAAFNSDTLLIKVVED